MKLLDRRLFILVLSVGSCIMTTGCFPCTECITRRLKSPSSKHPLL